MSASVPSQREEMRSPGRRSVSSAPCQSMVARAERFDGSSRVPSAVLVLAVGRQLLFHGEGHAQVWRELVPQFAGEDFRVDLRADDADGRLREHVRQVGPCGHAILVFGGDVRLLLAAGARQVGIAFVDPGADFACRVR